MNNKNTIIKIIAAFLSVCILGLAVGCGGDKPSNSNNEEGQNSTPNSSVVSGNTSDNSSNNSSTNKPNSSTTTGDTNSSTVQVKPDTKVSDMPTVTVGTQVAPGVCIVAGTCPKGTEYVTVKGAGVTTTQIVPYSGKNTDFYMGQVKINVAGNIEVTAKEKGKEESYGVYRYVNFNIGFSENYMTKHEYRPVIGLNSRAHFYSALLSYSLSSSKITSTVRTQAENNIKKLVSQASSVGAETIFLIIPSSAEVYPESVPAGYTKTKGETIFEAFEKIATSAGAKVIYPIDTMKKHKNDGVGYQLYQYTDSHWSTYGAYWGTYDLFNYIAQKFPAAKPRTVKEMGFYTKEMYAGDAVFNFPSGIGFDSNTASGVTSKTGMKELTNLYTLNVNTLSGIYHGNTGLYLTDTNAAAQTVYNKAPTGLPNAVIMRDSFGKVAFDMVSDRFATACWGKFGNYNLPSGWQNTNPDYVIHLYSERNLFKIMLADSNASIVSFK